MGPQPNFDMTQVHNFATDFPRARKGFKEIKVMVDCVYRDKSLNKTAIYDIIKKTRMGKIQRNSADSMQKKTKQTGANIQCVAAFISQIAFFLSQNLLLYMTCLMQLISTSSIKIQGLLRSLQDGYQSFCLKVRNWTESAAANTWSTWSRRYPWLY